MDNFFSLVELVELSKAKKLCYEELSGRATDPVLAKLITVLIERNKSYEDELLNILPNEGRDLNKSTFITDAIYSDLRKDIETNKDSQYHLIGLCQKIEQITIDFYQTILSETTSDQLREIIENQLTELKNGMETLRMVNKLFEAKNIEESIS